VDNSFVEAKVEKVLSTDIENQKLNFSIYLITTKEELDKIGRIRQ